jgi:protein-disulfide isomerase
MKQSHFTLIALLLIGAGFALLALVYNTQQGDQTSQQVAQNRDALIRPHSVRAGNPQAKVTLVEFMDPACETCGRFHPLVKQLLDRHGGKMNLVVRYAPLHQGSDQMVAILEAARMQDKFWPVLELMFQTQSTWAINHAAHPDIFWNLLTQSPSGLDLNKLQQDMASPAVVDAIRQDIADGEMLGATKTPTFFVNGKPLPSFGYDQLVALINSEISANY